MTRLWIALLFATTATTATTAHADVLRTARDQPLVEVSHTVEIWLDHGTATYRVQRQFANHGNVADEAGLAIDLPYGGAATGLRIRAHKTWYDGELMERGKAAELYQHLTGHGAFAPKDPALLQWLWADKLYLQVFPVLPGEVSTVEYTLTVPTRYQNGRYVLSYPRTDGALVSTLATPVITVHADGVITIDGAKVVAATPTSLVPPKRDELATDRGASYGISKLVVPASTQMSRPFDIAHLTVDIRHTYKSDLLVELVAPSGARMILFDRKGGGDNNIQQTFDVPLPEGTEGAGTWKLVTSDHVALDTGSVDSWKLSLGAQTFRATDTPVFVPDAPESEGDAGVAAIWIAPPPFSTWMARLGRVVASEAHAFARLEIDVAAQLAALPRRAQVVFVVDASYSVGPEFLATELAIVEGYLTHVPDADVELIAVQRHARRVFGRFVRATDVHKQLAAHPIELGNGSALDEGARLAADTLAGRVGPTRVVIATDELLRTALSPQRARAALDQLAATTIVHVVRPTLDDSAISIDRDDARDLAPLAATHHGIFATISGRPAQHAKELEIAALELVRPTKLEHVSVTGGFALDGDVLREGVGVRLFAKTKADAAPTQVTLAGVLWSDPVNKDLVVDAAFSRTTAAFVFGADEHADLSPEEMMAVAMLGRAVSPVTSYVAAEPGTRPSSVGLGEITTGRYGSIGHGSGTGSGYGSGGVRRRPHIEVDPAGCLRAHPQAAIWSIHLDVETTKTEIVDVKGPSDAFARCLIEEVWTIRLGEEFFDERESYAVDLRS